MFGFTKCGKCEAAAFKIQEISPQGAAYKFYAIQCTGCQTPIGVTDYFNIGAIAKKQEKKLEEMEQKLSQIQHDVHQIAQAMQR